MDKMKIVIEQKAMKMGEKIMDPEFLMEKLGRLEIRRGSISQVQVYYRKNNCYRPPFNRGGYIRMKVTFETGEVERYYLGERPRPIYTDHISRFHWKNS